MSTFDFLLGLAALALVLWNMRRHEMTDRSLRRPLIIAGAVGVAFLHSVPTAGADGALVAIGLLAGVACGLVSALATRVEVDEDGTIVAAPSALAVAVTGVAFAGRLAFAVAATHGLGPAIARFSAGLGVHSQQAWVAALVLMAVADLLTRTLLLWQRRQALGSATPAAVAA